MIRYTISECQDGRFVVQRPNGFGGLYPLVESREDVRDTKVCFDRIHEDAVESNLYDGIEIIYRWKQHPENEFTRED